MKKIAFIISILLVISNDSFSQIGISNDGSTPDPSSMLDVESTEKGLLIPRMTKSQITALQNPADGLLVYNSDNNRFYFFDGSAIQWVELAIGPGYIVTNCGSITDTCGNTYSTVQIGPQCWMAENLKTTRFNDGSDIPLITSNSHWNSLTTPGYCWYNNDEATYGDTYGAMYNWYTVNAGNLCPTGWHTSTDAEWADLQTYLGGQSVAGGKMKEAGLVHWDSPNEGATNETSFTGLPGGYRFSDGNYYFLTRTGFFWSSTEYDIDKARLCILDYNNAYMVRHYDPKKYGFSVRCAKD